MAGKLHRLFIGSITMENSLVFLSHKPKQPECIYALNGWLFDMCYGLHQTIKQLPPLDDWTCSVDNGSLVWSFKFDEPPCEVKLWSELIEF